MTCSGLCQGELLALQWEDVNLVGRFLEVRKNFTHGRLTTPKSGEPRQVDHPGATGPGVFGTELIGSLAISGSYEEGGWGG